MKIYIATKWENKPHAREIRSQLEQMGHVITSQWLDTGDNDRDPASAAKRDVADVHRAHLVLVLQDGYDTDGGCGMWVEMGIAIGFGRPVVVLTATKTLRGVFHSLPGVFVIASLSEFFKKEEKSK